MITNLKAFVFILISFLIFSCNSKQIIIYVDSNKETKNLGSESEPFSNLESAFDYVFTKLSKDQTNNDIIIKLLPGEYYLSKTIKILPRFKSINLQGSGSNNTYIKGSELLDLKWKKLDNNIWEADLNNSVDFDQLYLNDEEQILARYPNFNENGGHWNGYAEDVISKERIKKWKNPIGAFVHITHKAEWGDFHYKIIGIDKNGEAILEGGHQNNRPENGLHPKFRMVENVFEELDTAKEYFHDKAANKIYLFPSNGIDPNKCKIEVSVLKNIFELSGSIDEPLKNVKIIGISFKQTKRTFMEKYDKLLRSDWAIYRGGAVFISGTENIQISDCEFSNLGGNAVFINSYNRKIKIFNNHIHNVGATGIAFVGDTSSVRSPSFYYYDFIEMSKIDTISGPKNKLYPSNCLAENNLIHKTGMIEKQTSGIQISMSMNIIIKNNSIYDVPRAGINISEGTWGGHIIEFNDIFNTVLETGDHGSFNSWGRDRYWHPNRKILDSLVNLNPNLYKLDAVNTTIIRNNRIRCDHGWDIDLDDGSSNYIIYNNLCLNGGIKLREGFNRIVENNILINNGFHPHVWFKNSKDIFKKNIVMTEHKDILLNDWGSEVNYNFFTDKSSLEKTQMKSTDKNSICGDPEFIDPKNLDFRISDKSPVHKIGFKNFSMQNFGVQEKNLKRLAKKPDSPILILSNEDIVSDKKINWLGANIKSITTLGERSATGLNDKSGILILNVSTNSLADIAGLKSKDVIVECEGNEVKNIFELLKIYQSNNWKGKLDLGIFRNQKLIKLEIITK